MTNNQLKRLVAGANGLLVTLQKVRTMRTLVPAGALAGLLAASTASAHTFFEGLVSVDVNPRSKHVEIVHSYTAHDLTALLMEQTQLAINLEHPEHEALLRDYIEQHFVLRDYIEQHFVLRANGKKLELAWVGIRLTPQTIEIYQELSAPPSLASIEVQNDVLRSALQQQINRVNFSQGECRGSVVFDRDSAKRQLLSAPCLTPSTQNH